jgi:DNA-binding NarL/FixJ family response regulator
VNLLGRFSKPPAPKPSLSAKFAATFFGPKKILFLDDNGLLVEMLELDATSKFQVEFLKAKTVAEAMSAISQGGIDGAILDCRLTNGNGPQVYRTIIERWPTMPVVFLTVYGSTYEQEIRKIGPASIMDKNLISDSSYLEAVFSQLGVRKKLKLPSPEPTGGTAASVAQ